MPFINPKEFKKWGLDKEIENVMQQLTVTSRAESRKYRITSHAVSNGLAQRSKNS